MVYNSEGIKKIDAWLSLRKKWIIVIIILISTVLRVFYFEQSLQSPIKVLHEWEESDMNFFFKWGKVISEGNILCDTILHPHHTWHKMVADVHFEKHPALKENFSDSISDYGMHITEAELLWQGWWGYKRFHQEPLYAYITGGLMSVSGGSLIPVYLLQLLLGVIAKVLIYLITRRYFGDFAAVLASFLVIFTGTFLFYEFILLRTTLVSFFCLLLIFLFGNAMTKGRYHWLILGLFTGLAFLLKGTFLLFLLGVIIILLFNKPLKHLFKPLVLLFVSFLITVSPLILRNIVVGAPAVSFASTGSIAFITANNAEATPVQIVQEENTEMILHESGGSFTKAVLLSLQTHPNLIGFIKLMWSKFNYLWHSFEIPNNTNIYFFEKLIPILKVTFIGSAILSPLILLGAVVAIVNRKKATPLYLMTAVQFISVMGFFVLARFRVPLFTLMVPFAGYFVVFIIDKILSTKASVIIWVMALVGLVIWNQRTLPGNFYKNRFAEYSVVYNLYYIPLLNQSFEKEDHKTTEALFEELIKLEPGFVKKLNNFNRVVYVEEATFADLYIDIYTYYSDYLWVIGDEHKSQRMLSRAINLSESLIQEE